MKFAAALLVTLSLSLVLRPGAALAGALEDGIAAYNAKNYDAAVKLLQPLAEQGNGEAQYQLGFMYLYGQGMAQNYTEAYFWLAVAARTAGPGGKDAVNSAAGRNQILKHLTPDQVEAVKARVEDWKPAAAKDTPPTPEGAAQ